jgi:O-Antigen ligase
MPAVRPRLASQLYWLYWVLLVGLAAAFELKAGAAASWIIGFVIIGVTVALYRRSPILALCTLPGTLMLGVIARLRFGGASLQLGDLHLFALLVMLLAGSERKGRLFIGRPGLTPLVAIVIVLSWVLSVDMAASTVAVFGLLELFLLYCLTLNLVKSDKDAIALLRSWWGTITLCSALVIISYVRAEPLILDANEGFVTGFGGLKDTGSSFVRASFFTTSFNYPLACTLVMLTVNLLLARASMAARGLWFAALIVNIGAMVLLGNRSVIGAALAGGMVAIVCLARYKRIWVSIVGIAIALFILAQVSTVYIEKIINPRQLLLFLVRIQGADSFFVRLKTWSRVSAAVLSSPHAMLIGLGPDASTRGSQEVFGPILGDEHGVDSQFFFILLNYGVIILVIYLRCFARAIWHMLASIRGNHKLVATLIMTSLVTWLVLGIGQQLGASKTLGLGAQLLAIVELIRMRRIDGPFGASARVAGTGVNPSAAISPSWTHRAPSHP